MGGHPVNGGHFVAAAKAGLGGRRAFVGLVDEDIAVHVRLVDKGTHTAVSAGEHHLEVFLLFFRDVLGVGVQGSQHGIHAGALDAAHFQGIYVRTVKLLEDGILYLHPLAQGEVLGLRRCA